LILNKPAGFVSIALKRSVHFSMIAFASLASHPPTSTVLFQDLCILEKSAQSLLLEMQIHIDKSFNEFQIGSETEFTNYSSGPLSSAM
jgi:hypothetical protein